MLTLRPAAPRGAIEGEGLFALYQRRLYEHWGARERAVGAGIRSAAEVGRLLDWSGRANALSRGDIMLVREGVSGPVRLDQYLGMFERKGMHRLLNPDAYPVSRNPLKNKKLFGELAEASELPVPATFAVGRFDAWLRDQDAVIVKPRSGSKGKGIVRYRRDGHWDVAAMTRAARGGAVVQRALAAHDALAGLSLGALPTLRVMTFKGADGTSDVYDVLLRIPANADVPVDNFNAGNLVGRVDGTTARAAWRRVGGRLSRHSRHPVTDAVIDGAEVPLVDEARALAMRAHSVLCPAFRVVGWDIGLSSEGAVLIEGNWNPGTDVLQLASGVGLAATPLGERYREALAALPDSAWRAASAVEGEPQ